MLTSTQPAQSPLHSLLKTVSDILAKPQTLPTRLTLALKTIAQELGASTAILYLLSPDRYLEVYAVYDSTNPVHKKIRFRVGEGVVGFIAAIGKSVICDNIARHPNFLFHPGIADHVNLSLLGVPLISPQGLMGVLTLQNPPSNPFDQWRERSLLEIGNYLALLPELQRFPVLNVGEGKAEVDLEPNLPDVLKNKIDWVGFDDLAGFINACCFEDLKIVLFELPFQEASHKCIVFNDQNGFLFGLILIHIDLFYG